MDLKWKDISSGNEDGSSLIAVLIIITIMSFLIGSVMMGMIIQNRFIQRDVDQLQARYSAEAGIYHFLADSTLSILPESDTSRVHLLDSSYAFIQAKPFGGFLSVTSTAKSGGQSKTVRTLVGNQATALFDHAVVLGDIRSALNLTGTTSIKGDIAVGPQGVRKSPFKGKLFEGSVESEINESKKTLFPEFDKTLFSTEIAYCDSLLRNPPQDVMQLEAGRINLSRTEELKNGSLFFVDGDLKVTSSSEFELPEGFTLIVTGNLTLDGAIIYNPFTRFITGKNLIISGELQGRNAIFYASEELEIESKKPFSGQFIANKEILITAGSYLRYPSVVYLKGEVKEGIREGKLEISESSIVEGTLMIPAPEEVISEDESRLVVGENSTIRGTIYNTGQTELHGKVLGSVLTLQFYFYHSPTAYINWLKDVTINAEKRPQNYVIPLGFSEKRKFETLEWQEIEPMIKPMAFE